MAGHIVLKKAYFPVPCELNGLFAPTPGNKLLMVNSDFRFGVLNREHESRTDMPLYSDVKCYD